MIFLGFKKYLVRTFLDQYFVLQVLEYLAEKPQILTQEHITGGPPCPGMERSLFFSSLNNLIN